MFLKQRVGDFETASGCDLKKAGAARYAEDITTEILCFSWGAPGAQPRTWFPWMAKDHPVSKALLADVFDFNVTWIAHNALFEKSIWRNIMVPVYGYPDIPDERWHDTMAVCAMKAIPLELDTALRTLGLPHEKDMVGSRFTIGLSKPDKKTGMLNRTPEAYERTGEYCEQDVRVEAGLHGRIGWLSPGERRIWLMDQKINERGVMLDRDFIRAAQKIVAKATVPLAREFKEITGFNFTQRDSVLAWVRSKGVAIDNMQKGTLTALLGEDENGEEPDEDAGALVQELPPDVTRALRIRQLIGSAAIKKLPAMEACICSDGAARGLLQYHRAGTGRWAGRLLQPQNFPRGSLGKYADAAALVDAILTEDPDWLEIVANKPPIEAILSSLRYALKARAGKLFVSGDFAQIEMRVLLALAGQYDRVEGLRKAKDDPKQHPYIVMATSLYGRPIDKHMDILEYTIGKNSVLGFGFGMGDQKFHDRYAKDQAMEFCAEAKRVYWEDFAPMVPKLWYGLERAAVETVHSGKPHEYAGIRYALEDGWLTAHLPSNRKLWYWNPQPGFNSMPWDPLDVRPGFTYQALKTGRVVTISAYGGLLAENVVQALARDLLASAMFRCENENMPVVLTVHDETVTEVDEAKADEKAMEQVLSDSPQWALDLRIPVEAEVWIGDRYRK